MNGIHVERLLEQLERIANALEALRPNAVLNFVTSAPNAIPAGAQPAGYVCTCGVWVGHETHHHCPVKITYGTSG